MIKGRVRGTVIGPDGYSETNDFEPGDVWYFPRGHGHALQCLGHEEAHFILIFDNGNFSEYGTFSITDWLAHTLARSWPGVWACRRRRSTAFRRTRSILPAARFPRKKTTTPLEGTSSRPTRINTG